MTHGPEFAHAAIDQTIGARLIQPSLQLKVRQRQIHLQGFQGWGQMLLQAQYQGLDLLLQFIEQQLAWSTVK